MKKRLWSVILVLCLMLSVFALGEGAKEGMWYEVFVYSYSDSDGDGIGDLRGLISKLDYIQYMGYTGIWLMPVMPSPSYHKYDVTDYFDIDPAYGTLDDMRELVSECHARGIRVIIDLVVNHTSTRHKWFQLAATSLRFGNLTNKYIGYYNFRQTGGSGYARLDNTGWFYEEQFSGGNMPDLNLENPDVKRQIEKIMRFWLTDVDVDGFRLDAVTSYMSTTAGSIEFLSWLNDAAKAIKPDCYIVGEAWTSLGVISEYYQSGVDSFFLFPASQAEGYIVTSIKAAAPAESYVKALLATEQAIPEGIIAPFLGNHDTGRTVGLLQARSDPDKAKFAEGILNMFPGSVFTYYGEEIGMVGSGVDPNKRIGMYWADGEITTPPPGATRTEYAYPGVYEQMEDENSLLSYCRRINLLKAANPVVMQGRTEAVQVEKTCCVLRRFTEDDECLIAINFDRENPASVSLTGAYTLASELEIAQESASVETADGTSLLTLPPYGIALLRNAEN